MQDVSGSYCIGVLQGAVTHKLSSNSSLQVWWAIKKIIFLFIGIWLCPLGSDHVSVVMCMNCYLLDIVCEESCHSCSKAIHVQY